jgi:glycerol-3-phosphate O-acyltransferase
VSVSYDQLREAEEYAGEGRGAAKKAESLGWLVKFVRAQRGRYGTIYVRFGEPVSVREALGPPVAGTAARDEVSKLALQKLAFEVSWRINHASPITGTSLVTLTLLAARGVAMTAIQIRRAVQGYLVYARRRGLPMAPTAALDTQQAVMETLTALEGSGVLSRYAEGPEAVYSVGGHEHLAASYYRNSIIHFFLLPAIAELALLQAAEVVAPERPAAFWQHAFELRDLLKFEFFFQEKDEFREALAAELGILAPDWARYLAGGPEGVRELLNSVEMLSSDMMLRSFIEAYLVLANALAGRADAAAVDEKAFLGECMALGQQYLLQRRIRNPEAVSRHLFQTGVQLARNRGLWDAGEGVSARRREFAARLTELARHMRTVNKVAVHRLEQETGSDAG